MTTPNFRSRARIRWSVAALLTLLWAILYLPHLRTSPGWYGDETLIHYTSRDLWNGRASNLALANTFWHPHYPYQPLYSGINGLFAKMAAGDLVGSRFFNTLLALFCALAIYFLGARTFGSRAALLASLMFLTYEQSIIHFRMSYAHNAVGLGILIMTLYLLRRASPKNDWLAGAGLALAAGSHPLFINGAFCGLLTRWRHPKSWFRLLTLSGLYLAVSLGILYLVYGQWLFEDLHHLKTTHLSRGETDGSGLKGLTNFIFFIRQDLFHVFCFLGLCACIPLRRYAAPVVGLGVLFLLVRNRQNLVPFYYHAIVILPVLCLGWAGLFRFSEKILAKRFRVARPALLLMFLVPLLAFVGMLPQSLSGKLTPRNQYWVTQSTVEVEQAAAWLNAQTQPGDVVAGNPNIAWLLKAYTVPYLQLITWYGYPTQGYENLNRRERFLFDASLENCKFAIFGDIDTRWAIFEPNVPILVERIKEEKWPIVWRGPNYTILKNPRWVYPPVKEEQEKKDKAD